MDGENPHDRFEKTVMSKLENAKDFFHGVLPEGLKRLIDLDTLRRDPDSYVDEELSEFLSDIVFTCRYRESPVKLVLCRNSIAILLRLLLCIAMERDH